VFPAALVGEGFGLEELGAEELGEEEVGLEEVVIDELGFEELRLDGLRPGEPEVGGAVATPPGLQLPSAKAATRAGTIASRML
jgi:hypothetical protein